MTRKLWLLPLVSAGLLMGQSQIDLNKQVRNSLPYASGGTNAATQAAARKNVGNPALVATDFPGADIGAQVNAAFASFGAGRCGTVLIPEGTYTQTTTIAVKTGCILRGMGRGQGDGLTPAIGTKLLYDGPPATVAIHLPPGEQYLSLSDLAVWTNAGVCLNNGMLKWNTAAAGANKWQCHDGSVYTSAVPHLAGILHGGIDPTVLADGNHVRVTNIDINGGGQNGNTFLQGGFHFGMWLNGCEECVIESVYAVLADDGFSIGGASNGVLGHQITARLNRRSGIHVRNQNATTLVLPLMESNRWMGQPVQAGYGAGFLCDGENSGGGVCRVGLQSAYFEGNWVDVRAPDSVSPFGGAVDGFSTVEGYFQDAILSNCVIPDASKVTVTGQLRMGCNVVSGAFNFSAGQSRLITTEGPMVTKVNKDPGGGLTRVDAFEMVFPSLNPSYLYFRGSANADQMRLDNPENASAVANTESPSLRFRGSKWVSGAPVEYTWSLASRASAIGGAPETTSGLYVTSNGAQMYAFRESGEFQIHKSDALATLGDGSVNNGNPRLSLFYRSDADSASAGGHIRTQRFDGGAGFARDGRLFFDDVKVATFQNDHASGAGKMTVALKAGASQGTTNLQEWQNNAGAVLAQVDGSAAMLTTGLGFTAQNDSGQLKLLQAAGGTGYRWRLNNDSSLRLESTTNDFSAVRGTPLYVNSSDFVGVGQSSALHRLDVAGAIKMGDEGTKPSCTSTERGTLWHDFGAAGVKDTVEICAKDAANTYAWRTLY